MDTLKVSSHSNPVSALIMRDEKYVEDAEIIREKGTVEVQGIGAGAVNQALKSVAVARGYLAPSGIDLVCIPAFTSVEVEGESKTAMKLIVEKR